MSHANLGHFLCSLDNLLRKNVIVFFFKNQISKWHSFEKKRLFWTYFSHFFSYHFWSKEYKLHKKYPILHVTATFSLKQGETRTGSRPIPHPINRNENVICFVLLFVCLFVCLIVFLSTGRILVGLTGWTLILSYLLVPVLHSLVMYYPQASYNICAFLNCVLSLYRLNIWCSWVN